MRLLLRLLPSHSNEHPADVDGHSRQRRTWMRSKGAWIRIGGVANASDHNVSPTPSFTCVVLTWTLAGIDVGDMGFGGD